MPNRRYLQHSATCGQRRLRHAYTKEMVMTALKIKIEWPRPLCLLDRLNKLWERPTLRRITIYSTKPSSASQDKDSLLHCAALHTAQVVGTDIYMFSWDVQRAYDSTSKTDIKLAWKNNDGSTLKKEWREKTDTYTSKAWSKKLKE